MIRRTLHTVITMTVVALIASCGGAVGVSGESGVARKKQKNPQEGDDQLATDPSVVTGAYLACEISPADTMDAKDTDRAVGCSVMTSAGRKLAIAPKQSLDFTAITPAIVKPVATNTRTGYHAVFQILTAQLPNTVYRANLMEGSKLIREFKGTVNNPLAKLALTETPAGLWQPLSGNIGFVNGLVGDYAFNSDCKAAPDAYCTEAGELSSESPAASKHSTGVCPDLRTTLGNVILRPIAGATNDGVESFARPYRLGADSSICTIKKKNPSGNGYVYFNRGAKCSVTVVKENGQPKTLVYKNSQLPFPADVMEKRMQAMACGTYDTR